MITVREYTDKDYNAATNLMRKLIEMMGEKFDEFRWKASLVARKSQQEGMFIAIEGEKVVGMSFADIRGKNAVYGYISSVIVDENYRGRGIGEHLIQKAIIYLGHRGVSKIQINVRKDAIGAINLYEKIGFKEKYRVMELELSADQKLKKQQPLKA
ncbi:MAG: GNAT family N-acetyltransferase [Promethearchaeota archaeon]